MEQIKLAADVSLEQSIEKDPAAKAGANDVRALSDLEMVLCGGGEGVVNW